MHAEAVANRQKRSAPRMGENDAWQNAVAERHLASRGNSGGGKFSASVRDYMGTGPRSSPKSSPWIATRCRGFRR